MISKNGNSVCSTPKLERKPGELHAESQKEYRMSEPSTPVTILVPASSGTIAKAPTTVNRMQLVCGHPHALLLPGTWKAYYSLRSLELCEVTRKGYPSDLQGVDSPRPEFNTPLVDLAGLSLSTERYLVGASLRVLIQLSFRASFRSREREE